MTGKTSKKQAKAGRPVDLGPPRPVPTVGPMARLRLPVPAVRVLANGLTVTAVRRPGVPLAQVRLLLPTSRPRVSTSEKAVQRVLGRTLLGGTSTRSQAEIADQLQRLGGGLGAGADAEDLSLSGASLSTALPALLATMHEVLTDARFPAGVVATERARTAQELQVGRSQPSTQAAIAVGRAVFGDHPYGDDLPDPADVLAVTSRRLAAYLTGRVGPAAGQLVIVSDLTTKRMLDLAEAALGTWDAGSPAQALPSAPAVVPGAMIVVDRPGSVQTSIRLAGLVPGRAHPEAPAVALSTTLLGGSFSSRLTRNLREDKGWTYSPGAGIQHLAVASMLTIAADVATEVTAPALVEIAHELGRLATTRVDDDELEQARAYRTGVLALSLETQAALATQLAVLASQGLGVDHVSGLPARYAAVTTDAVLAAAATHLAPSRLVTVLVGDAERIVPSLQALGAVTVVAPA